MLYSCAIREFTAAPVSVHFSPSFGPCPGHSLGRITDPHSKRSFVGGFWGLVQPAQDDLHRASLSRLMTPRSLFKVLFVQKDNTVKKSLALTRS